MLIKVYYNLLNSFFEEGRIGFHQLGRNPKITQLAFADDIVILFDGIASLLQGIGSSLYRFVPELVWLEYEQR